MPFSCCSCREWSPEEEYDDVMTKSMTMATSMMMTMMMATMTMVTTKTMMRVTSPIMSMCLFATARATA